jgi:hypothetical protein
VPLLAKKLFAPTFIVTTPVDDVAPELVMSLLDVKVRLPPVATIPVVLNALFVLLMVPEPIVPETASVPTLVLLTAVAPPVFNTSASVLVDRAPTGPAPAFKVIMPPDIVPVDVMAPVPFAVKVTEAVPLVAPPKLIAPFAAVEASVRFVVEETAPVVVMSPLAFTVRAPLVATIPALVMLLFEFVTLPFPSDPEIASGPAAVLVTVVEPPVAKTTAPTCVVSGPTVPAPALRFSVPPLMVPVDVIVPVAPTAVNVTVVVPVVAPPREMLPLVPEVDCNVRIVAALTAPVVVMSPLALIFNAPVVAVMPVLLTS